MESVDIEGVNVLFPYKPYDIQLDYMKNVIKCLKEKTNCLLESPTGTGKTLSILCPTMAWIESCKQKAEDNPINIPRVLFSSRTHSQLSQTVRQFKQTPYKSCQSVVIASRDQLCLNPEVMSADNSTLKSHLCRQLIRDNNCSYFESHEQKVDYNIEKFNESDDESRVLDIEDLVKFGKQFNCCPYYSSRYLSNNYSLVFTPYNYIIDPQIRESLKLNLNNCVIIFDEGHNIDKFFEDCMSIELTSQTLTVCIKHINSMTKKLKKIKDNVYLNKSFDRELVETFDSSKLNQFYEFLLNFQQNIVKMIRSESYPQTNKIFKILDESGFMFELLPDFMELIDKIKDISIKNKSRSREKSVTYFSALNSLFELFEKLIPNYLTPETYESHKTTFCRKYKIFGSIDNFSTHDWTLHIWCLSPSVGVKALTDLGIHNMIITSGTLAPFQPFETEMEIEFPIQLENSHVIKNNQLLVLAISHSRDDQNLISNYNNRLNANYFRALGQTLVEILSIVPKGVLIFFSSYESMKKSINHWKQCHQIWKNMNDLKQLFIETNDKKTFKESILKYKQTIDEPDSKGAVFFGVCRAKLSEGIDLPNDYCRCVIMTGLPFPSVADPRVKLKKQYLNEVKTRLSADGWYALQMKRSLNQSIGRVVRHKDDFGVVILLDSRFISMSEELSKWVHKFIYRKTQRISDQNLYLNNKIDLNQKLAKIRQFFSFFKPNNSNTDINSNINQI